MTPFLKKERGFTLIEVLIGFVILTLALIPLYDTAIQAISVASMVENRLIASNLAQEGIEVVRAIRDANWFNNVAFDTGLIGCGPLAGGCRVMINSTSLVALNDNPVFTVYGPTGVYYYKDVLGDIGGTDSIYRRKITITAISASQLKVESEVTWPERGETETLKIESHLFNWK